MKESVIETPLIGSGSMEEAVNRVNALLTLGTSRGYLTYDELNERLPDEVVSPDKLDSLLMMIDEMGIKLIDELDVPEYQQKGPRPKAVTPVPSIGPLSSKPGTASLTPLPEEPRPEELAEEEEEEIDLNLEA